MTTVCVPMCTKRTEPSSSSEPVNVLANTVGALDALKTGMATIFGSLGTDLEWIAGEARAIASRAVQAAQLFGQKESGQAVALLRGLRTDVDGARDVSSNSYQAFREIHHNLALIVRPLDKLQRSTFRLKNLSLLCRIEQRQANDSTAQQLHLADDVDQLAQQIREHIDQIRDGQTQLMPRLHSGLQRLDAAQRQDQSEMGAMIGHIEKMLSEMLARGLAAQQLAENAAQHYAEVQSAIEQVVISLQVEDIARQQIEHVQQALGEAQFGPEDATAQTALWFLQRAQVESTQQVVGKSLATVADNLSAAGRRIREIAARREEETGEAVDEMSRVASLDESLHELTGYIAGYVESSQSVAAVLADTVPLLEAMVEHAHALELADEVVRCTALNALIETSALSMDGAAMKVISTEIQAVSVESAQEIEEILGCLGAMKGKIDLLEGDDEKQMVLHVDADKGAGVLLQQEAERMEASTANAQQLLDELRMRAGVLCGKTDALCERLSAINGFAEGFAEPLQSMTRKLEELGWQAGMVPVLDAGRNLNELADRYSMDSERFVHEQLLGHDQALPEQVGELVASATDSEFGDGIELF